MVPELFNVTKQVVRELTPQKHILRPESWPLLWCKKGKPGSGHLDHSCSSATRLWHQANAFYSSSLSLSSQKHDGSKAACLFFLQEMRLSFMDVNRGCSDLSMATALGCGLSSLPTLHTRSAHRKDYLPTLAGLVGPKAGVPSTLVFFQTECPSTSAHTLECRNAGVSSWKRETSPSPEWRLHTLRKCVKHIASNHFSELRSHFTSAAP